LEYPIKCRECDDNTSFYTFTSDGKHVAEDKYPSIYRFSPFKKAAHEVSFSNKKIEELKRELRKYKREEEIRNKLPY
jgi:hypothetical protein